MRVLFALFVVSRAGLWFALMGLFLMHASVDTQGRAFAEDAGEFAWYFILMWCWPRCTWSRCSSWGGPRRRRPRTKIEPPEQQSVERDDHRGRAHRERAGGGRQDEAPGRQHPRRERDRSALYPVAHTRVLHHLPVARARQLSHGDHAARVVAREHHAGRYRRATSVPAPIAIRRPRGRAPARRSRRHRPSPRCDPRPGATRRPPPCARATPPRGRRRCRGPRRPPRRPPLHRP